MSQPQDYRATKWGQACVALWREMVAPSTPAAPMPDVKCAIGPDEVAQTLAPPIVTFMHAGEDPTAPWRGGGLANLHVWDRKVYLNIECWGATPADAEALEEAFLIAVDTLAHGRAGKPGKFKPVQGSATAGNLGSKMVGSVMIIPSYVLMKDGQQLAVSRATPRSAVPTSHGVSVGPTSPDGTSSEVVTLE